MKQQKGVDEEVPKTNRVVWQDGDIFTTKSPQAAGLGNQWDPID